MKLFAIKSVNDENIDKIISENLYRGHIHAGLLKVQCMDKDMYIIFDFKKEVATIETETKKKIVPINSYAYQHMAERIIKATC